MSGDVPETAITAAMAALATHRWKSMGVSSVECECGAILYGPGLTQFPADESFRRHLADAALAAAAPHIAAAKRERIRQLAIDHNALYLAHGDERQLTGMLPFADLLGGTADGTHTPGGTT